MENITNLDIVEELHSFIKEGATLKELLIEYGGTDVYFPHYKTVFRNQDILKDHENGMSVKKIARKFDLSASTVRRIIKEVQQCNS